MDLKEIQKLIESLEKSRLKKMIIKEGDWELHLEKEDGHVRAFEGPIPPPVHSHPQPHPHHPPHHKEERHPTPQLEGKFVTSPMVGTYYSAPAPDHPTFVKVGDRVEASTVVCIIEAMKVMNEVKAGASGTVAEILIDNAHPVEFGTRLIRIT